MTRKDSASGLRLAATDTAGGRFVIVSLPLALPRAIAARLTPAEREVAWALAAGGTYASIASERHVALRTIANQVSSIFRKLGVTSRAELLQVLNDAST